MTFLSFIMAFIAGAVIALSFVFLGFRIANRFEEMAYKRYQQGITDGWKARGVRNDLNAASRRVR